MSFAKDRSAEPAPGIPPQSGPPQSGPFRSGPGQFGLRLLATSDLHVHLTSWDYYADRASAASGLARTATLIAAARAEMAAVGGTCLLLDNGDFLHGSPLGDLEALRDRRTEAVHPMIAAMNALGYDAACLGNHEFSGGLDFLMSSLKSARFPVVSANIAHRLGDTPLRDDTLVPPTLILSRDLTDGQGNRATLKIGLVGLVPPQTTQWDRQQLGGELVTRDILEAAAAHVPDLRARGADIVIALSHSGIGSATSVPQMENATAALAALPGIDALIAGHTHQTFPSPDIAATDGIDPVRGLLWGKPAVMPGFHGSHLGVIDLTLNRDGGVWRVSSHDVRLRPIARRTRAGRVVALTPGDRAILGLARTAHHATRTWTRQPIGQNAGVLHSYFSLVLPCPTVRLVARAQAEHVAGRLRGGPYGDLPVISAAAPFHAGGRGGPENYTVIPPGPVVMRHAFDIYPHPNTIAALLVTGAELALWLERSFSLFHQVRPGARDAPLIDPEFPAFNFDLLDGLTWEVDLTRPRQFDTRGTPLAPGPPRIHKLRFRGSAVDPQGGFVLATNSYRAAGSGGFAGASPDRMILCDAASSRDILLAHISGGGALSDATPPNWAFTPLGDTSVIFETSPDAAAHLADLSGLRPEALDLTPAGFRRFRLHL